MASLLETTLALVPSIVKGESVLSQPFLSTCRQVLPVLDKLGTGLSIVRSDVSGNIERLQKRFESDPVKFESLRDIVVDEKSRNVQTDNAGCTKGLLWLMRAMKLIVEMLERFSDGQSPADSASGAYDIVLRPFHGYMTFGVFKVAMSFVPSRESFLNQLGVKDEGKAAEQMKQLKAEFGPILAKIESTLEAEGCNFPDRV